MTDKTQPSDSEIGRFLDGEVIGAERARIAEQLLAEPGARARYDADSRIKGALRAALEAHDPEPTAYADEAGALAELARRRPWLRWQMVAAGVALVATGWCGRVGYELWDESQVPAMVENAAQAHQVFAHDSMRPVETTNLATLTEWFSSHVGEPVTVPDLGSAGLHFVGGRLLSSDQGALAQMIYEDARGRRLSLYLAGEDGGDQEVEIVELDEVDAGYWSDGGVAYAVVAETSVEQVIAVAYAIGEASGNDASRN